MHRMCAADRLLACLRQTQKPDLSLSHEIRHRADDFLDRNGGIHAVLIKEIDVIGAEPAQRSLDCFANVCGPAVYPGDAARVELEAELCRDDDALARDG